MPPPPTGPAAWPRWIVVLASVPIVFHLGSVALAGLAASSGPWPIPDGAAMAVPPPAVSYVYEGAALPYLQAVGLTHNHHFATTNRIAIPDAFLEVRLEDEGGHPLKTVRFPAPDAPPLVRQRQALLIRWMVEDQPVAPPRAERIFPPGWLPPRVPIWEIADARRLVLTEVPETEVPRNRIAFRPTPWSLVVIRSIARHACRVHGAAHASVLRHSHEPASPEGLLLPQAIPPALEDLVSDYGRVTK